MISGRNRERLGDLLAVIVAILLASVIVALAGPGDALPQAAILPNPVRVEISPPGFYHRPVLPAPISPDAGAGDALRQLAAEERCLADVIYFEARGENEAG